MIMCYKIEVQNKNAEKLNRKLDELNLPIYMRKYFTVKIESKAGALNYLGVIVDLLNWFIEEKFIDKTNISDIEPSDFNEVMAEDITLYLKTKEQNGMSPTTLETRKNIIRSFWNYISRVKGTEISDKFFDDVTYRGISSGSNLIKKLPTEQQLKDMEERILWKKDEVVRNRNIAIFNVLKGTGLRESELAGLDLSDLHLDEDMPYVTILGKGRYREAESRTVYLTNGAYQALKNWLEYRKTIDNIVDSEAVFVNKNGKRTIEDNIKAIFKNYGNGITSHMMRHWYASIMASKGNLAFAQQQLGHTSMMTTINNYANGSVGMKDILENM
jgi:integrase family protein|uniref:SITE SPECIFIC RECOMBINASE XERD n=1 Tax=virus sp. ctBS918 TaxID=2825807 RepID=A0A8S5RNU8_9VIRU|nr:MAG TPA: SITE SPECIFIC RECOMBINASE XERD [virus sp. ctBS918]DAI04249.1 MAG TPA: SITE SPECIFIC RECOMBINASE XERD [Caudoviricetes sp.]